MPALRDALGKWFTILDNLPKGTEIQINEEAASPGPGARLTVALVVLPNLDALALAIRAGTYDGEARVFAEVFRGPTSKVKTAIQEWNADIDI